jgi:hypothetical protein
MLLGVIGQQIRFFHSRLVPNSVYIVQAKATMIQKTPAWPGFFWLTGFVRFSNT